MCPLSDNFDGTVEGGLTLNVITAGGAGTTVPVHGIEDIQFPPRSRKIDKYTPLSGTYAGKERVILCSDEAGQLTASLTYEVAHQAAMDAIVGTNGCQITLTMGDGLTLVANGGISRLGQARVQDSRHITSDIAIDMDAGWTLTAGDGITRVAEYLVSMTDGAVTIDLTACGSAGADDLTDLEITKLSLRAKGDNANAITVAVGASNGYDIIGTFSQILSAGQKVIIEPGSAAPTVGATEKTFDVSGTGTQGVYVYIEAQTPA